MPVMRYCAALLLALGVAATALAESPNQPPALLLVPGVYGLKATNGTLKPSIHADFVHAFETPDQAPFEALRARLRERFNQAFAAEKVEAITAEAKYRTYAVSLEVLRADQYQVARPDGTVDLYLPVSLRLYITNLLSGEVLYSQALTSYRQLQELQADLAGGRSAPAIAQAYREATLGLVDQLIDATRAQFKPFQVSATVVARPFGLYVVDKGIGAGIAVGTELVNAQGAGIRILHAGKSYAVGEATLGDIAVGEALSMYASVAAADIVKPRTLVMDADAPADLPGGYAAVQFAENLGNQAAFTVVPVNPDFQDVLQAVASTQGLQQAEVTQKRVLPEYVVRLKIAEPVVYHLTTNKAFSRLRVLSGTAWAELLDAQGRVVYVTSAQEQIEDEILDGGIAFDSADRRKVLYGNLLKALSEQFIRDVKFREDTLTVSEAGERIVLADPQGLVSEEQSLRLYRTLTVDGIAEPVQLPLWDMTARESVEGGRRLEKQLPVTAVEEKLRRGDSVRLQLTSSSSGAQRAALCPSLQDKSGVTLKEVRALAYFALGAGSPLPYYGGDTRLSDAYMPLGVLRERLKSAGFRGELVTSAPAPAQCYQPLIKVDETRRECNETKGVCEIELQLVAGVNLLRGDTSIAKKILVVKSTLKNVPLADSFTFVQTQAAQKLYPLLADSVRQLAIPAADALSPPLAQGK